MSDTDGQVDPGIWQPVQHPRFDPFVRAGQNGDSHRAQEQREYVADTFTAKQNPIAYAGNAAAGGLSHTDQRQRRPKTEKRQHDTPTCYAAFRSNQSQRGAQQRPRTRAPYQAQHSANAQGAGPTTIRA